MAIDLTQGIIKEHIVKLALPAVIGYFFHTVFNITDTYFAGKISTQALAALSLSASIFFMLLAIGIGMSEAVSSLVGNALGEKDLRKARHITMNALIFALFLSIFTTISGILSVPYLIQLLSDSSYYNETLEYVNIILYASLFFIGSFFFNSLLNATGDMKSFRNILIFTAVLNVFLDYLFVVVFEMGIDAIAFATIISEAITMFFLFYKLTQTKLWNGLHTFTYDAKVILEFLKQGFPPSMNMFMMAFGMYLITYFVAPFGKEAVGAFGIGMRIEQLFLMPVVGLNVATLAIVSQNNGAKEYERISASIRHAIQYGWIISTLGVISFFLFGEYFASLLTSNHEVILETALYLKVSGFASYGFVLIFIYIAMLQGIGQPSVIFPISLYRQVIAPVIVFSLLAYIGVGILWLWIALDIIIFSSALFLWWYGEKKLRVHSYNP